MQKREEEQKQTGPHLLIRMKAQARKERPSVDLSHIQSLIYNTQQEVDTLITTIAL